MFLPSKMNKLFIWGCFIFSFVLLHITASDEEDGAKALTNFIAKLSSGNGVPDPILGWNSTSDPCKDSWEGIVCDRRNVSVTKIFLDGFSFPGIFDPSTLCDVQSIAASLTVISLNDNGITGENLEKIANCRQLTRLHISGNQFSGSLPDSLTKLNNLKRIDISRNKFYGAVPDLARISGLTEFSAQNNQLSGSIPDFDFSNLVTFNVSSNNFSGSIPSGGARLPVTSFINNPQLCGDPLPKKCPSASESASDKSKSGNSKDQLLMFAGYFLIALVLFLLIILWFCKKGKKKEEKDVVVKKVAGIDDSFNKSSFTTVDIKTGFSKSETSAASVDDSAIVSSSSLIVLTNPEENGLRFENLLKAPAELLGKGKHGSVYKVIYDDLGMTLAVKRIRDWTISSSDFKLRMQRLNQVKHPNVLPAIAFYSTSQEKLLVYEYQQHGSLFKLIHGTERGQAFDWSSRLYVAATIADALAFMHQELHDDKVAHGNLKSSNILLNKNLEPSISEYGLMVVDNDQDQSLGAVNSYQARDENYGDFKADIYAFGVILLELLTAKLVMINGMDLASWVLSAVKEEWTVEVFDKTLIQEGASEERMVNLLQIAIKCVNRSPEARPSMNQVALMINTLKEEEEKSMDLSEP